MKDLLTVFILTYERPKFLEDCLLSLDKQTFKDFEVIILDNSKKSNNSNIQKLNLNFKLQYIKNIKNLGAEGSGLIAYNWNIKTKYFMIFHDDDLMNQYYLEKSINILNKNKDIAWIGCNSTSKKDLVFKNYNISIKKLNKKKLISEIFLGLNFTLSSLIYNKNNLSKLNFQEYVEKYSILNDRPHIIDLIKINKTVAIINEPMIYYRTHINQESKTTKSKVLVSNQINFFNFYKLNYEKNLRNYFFFNSF